jgi:hypothetical protein
MPRKLAKDLAKALAAKGKYIPRKSGNLRMLEAAPDEILHGTDSFEKALSILKEGVHPGHAGAQATEYPIILGYPRSAMVRGKEISYRPGDYTHGGITGKPRRVAMDPDEFMHIRTQDEIFDEMERRLKVLEDEGIAPENSEGDVIIRRLWREIDDLDLHGALNPEQQLQQLDELSIKEGFDLFRMLRDDRGHPFLLGAGGGAVGLGASLLSPQETEANPAGVFTKATKKAVEGMLSSASKNLTGHVLEGKRIKEVRKGRGNWRAIIFDDGSMQTVDKQYVNDLARAKGTKKYMERFQDREETGRVQQALKSLEYHRARSQIMVGRDTARKLHRDYLTRAKEFGDDVPPNTEFVFHNGKYFQMPKPYADLLSDMGVLEIMKSRRDRAAVKPWKDPRKIKKVVK